MLVVGAGPSGLSAAYHLALRGHHVTIKDAAAKPGGMMRYGIPAYRLPRETCSTPRSSGSSRWASSCAAASPSRTSQRELRDGAYDAAFLAVGAHVARNIEIPGGTAAHVIDAVSMLHGVEDGEPPAARPARRRLRRRRHRARRGPQRAAPDGQPSR